MAIGLYIRNENNIIQIDENYQNLELIQKGGFSGSSGPNGTETVAFPSDATAIIAVVCTSGAVSWNIGQAGILTIYFQGSNVAGEYFIFSRARTTTPLPKIGVVIRNKNTGAVVFSSNRRYMRVVDYRSGTLAVNGSVVLSYGSRKVAVAAGVRPYSFRQRFMGGGSFPITQRTWSGARLIAAAQGTVNYAFMTVKEQSLQGNLGGADYEFNNYSFMVIDVTGL